MDVEFDEYMQKVMDLEHAESEESLNEPEQGPGKKAL